MFRLSVTITDKKKKYEEEKETKSLKVINWILFGNPAIYTSYFNVASTWY